MSQPHPQDASSPEFDEIVPGKMVSFDKLTVEDLKNVRLTVTADLGQAAMLVRDVLELKQGSVVALDKLAGEMTDIYAGGMPLARGEVVVIADSIHVRVSEIFGLAAQDKDAEDD